MTDQPRARRRRNLTESLLTIVLTLEAVVVFFIALTLFGLRVLPAGVAFVGGAGLVVVLLLATATLRFRWGIALGWLLQLVIVSTGLLLPALYVVAAIFVAMWMFCIVRGRQVDLQNARGPSPSSAQPAEPSSRESDPS